MCALHARISFFAIDECICSESLGAGIQQAQSFIARRHYLRATMLKKGIRYGAMPWSGSDMRDAYPTNIPRMKVLAGRRL